MAYHSAYRGIVKAPNGDFDHLVRQVDPSHLLGGHWRFQSIDDDRRAMARGFTTPEDVLCAADSSEDDLDEIIIRWVRGANDSNVRTTLSGTASQHLQTIYELRSLLGLPISSRGQIPLYPISTNPKLKQYWEAKCRLRRPAPIDSTSQLPGRPVPSPLTPGPEHPSSSQPQHASPAAPKSPEGQITRGRSAKISKAARPKPVAKATPLQQRLGAPAARTTQPSAARPLSGDTAAPSLLINTIGQQQAPFQSTASPASTFVPPASSRSRNVPSIPRAALAWGLQSSPSPTPSSLGHGISQHNWVHPSSRNSNIGYPSSSATPQQQQEPNGIINPSQDTVTASSGAIAPSNIPYRSPYPASGTQDGRLPEAHTRQVVEQKGSAARSKAGESPYPLDVSINNRVSSASHASHRWQDTPPRHASPVVEPSTSPLAGDGIQKHVAAPYSATTPAVSTTSPPSTDSLSSSVAAPTAPSAFSENAGDIRAPTSLYAPRNATPTTSTRKSQEPFLDSLSSPVAPRLSSPPPHIEDVPIETSVTTDETPESTPHRHTPPGRGNKLPSQNDPSLQQKLGIPDIRSPDTNHTSVKAKATEAIPEPWCTYMKGLEELPCMDCGEDDGHRRDCHLGNIKPMQNLTILNYRTLTDAVELFDPDPWTTHFDPPEPEVEDAETQIRGMAEVIRNEDSYKDDEEFHNLPDEFMIMLWAFKTSDGVRVVKEDDWDSGIGESEIE